MATAKQKAWRAKFARLYGRKKGRKTSKRSPKVRRVKVMARRRRTYSRPRKRYFRRAKGFSISLLDLAKYSVMYGILTNQPLGTVITQLVNSIMNGDDSFIDILIGQVNAAIENIMARPIQIAIQETVVAYAFALLKKAVGSKKIVSVGKFSIRT